MAEDLMKKAELIKFYCMDIRTGEHQPNNSGRKGVKRLSEFLKGSEGESMQESHARMQRMLEETLTKNMYLQRDIEHLSKELETVRLSCLRASYYFCKRSLYIYCDGLNDQLEAEYNDLRKTMEKDQEASEQELKEAEEMDLEQENKNLLERLTALQEEKWLLEEQVNHLEQG
ncbi:hypothetical protein J437_LFUL008206, partial [Ladona fulva]